MHPAPLASVAGENEHQFGPAVGGHLALGHSRMALAGSQSRELLAELRRVAHQKRCAMAQMSPRQSGSIAEVGQLGRGGDAALGQEFIEPPRQRFQSGARSGRKGKHEGIARFRIGGFHPRRARRRRLQHQMGVGAAEAERADTGKSPAAVFGPVGELGLDEKRHVAERDMWIGLDEVQAGGDLAVLDGQRHLDQRGDPRRGLAMPDVGLDGTDGAAFSLGSVTRKGCFQRIGFDHVAQERARPVCFHVLRLPGRDAGLAPRVANHGLLGSLIRRGDAVAAAVLVHCPAANDCVNPVPIGQGLREALEHDQARALAADDPIGARVEALAAAIGGQPAAFDKAVRDVRRQNHVDPTRQRKFAFAVAKALTGPVGRHQRRRARRVDGQARSFQIEEVGQPVCRDAAGVAGAPVRVELTSAKHEVPAVVVRRYANEHAGLRTANFGGRLSRILEGFPRGLQQEPVLRINASGLARRNAEKRRVESVNVRKPTAPANTSGNVACADEADLLVDRVGIPPVGGDFADGIHPFGQQPPEGIRTRCTRQPAPQAHNRDRFARGLGIAADTIGRGALGPASQMEGERFDGRIVVGQRGGQPAPEPLLQFARQLHGVARLESVPCERLPYVDVAGRASQAPGKAIDQPLLDRFRILAARPRAAGAGSSRGRGSAAGRGHLGRRLRRESVVAVPPGHQRQIAVEEQLSAVPSLDLAAGRFRNSADLHQRDRVHRQIVLFGDRPADRREYFRQVSSATVALDFLGHDQAFTVFVHGKRCTAVREQRRMASLDRKLDVLGIMIATVDNQQILQSARYE